MKNKIGWCDMTWNPVIGCLNNCKYCYGKTMNKRFKFIENWNKPERKEKSFNKKFPKKPQRIFVGSMSEIYYWEKEWMERVLERVRLYPQHTFQFLTKFPEIYRTYAFPKNCWLGVTVTKGTDTHSEHFRKFRTQYIVFLLDINNAKINIDHKRFISFEPLLENINTDFLNSSSVNWVICGAETGNRKGKVIPEKQWIWDIIRHCQEKNIPVYVKDSIGKLYSQFRGIKEFPVVEV